MAHDCGDKLGADPAIVPEIIRQFGSGAARARPFFHWISQELLEQPERFPRTVFHEATHGVDISFHLSVRNRVLPADAARLGIEARNGGGGFHDHRRLASDRGEQSAKVACQLTPYVCIDLKPLKDAVCTCWSCASLVRSYLTSRPIQQL